MIATLCGTIFDKQPGRVIIDVRGVGYEALISGRTHDHLPGEGEQAFLFIHTNVREDAITLYGFGNIEEKKLFLLLNTVSGVGPKLGLAMLSAISAPELCQAIAGKNMARLTSLPGVGKKTAQRLCMELSEKIANLGIAAAQPPPFNREDATAAQDAVSALVNLGYPYNTALRAVESAMPDPAESNAPVEELIRQALRILAKKN